MIPFIVRPNHLTVFLKGDGFNVKSSASHYDAVMEAIRQNDVEGVERLVRPIARVTDSLQGTNFKVLGGEVFYGDKPLPDAMSTRLLTMLQHRLDCQPLQRFYEKLSQNPSFRAVNELFGFLDACDLPITEDGDFLAYKMVRPDFTDCFSGKFDNSVGAVCEVNRNEVDEDSDRTCSHGLHVCSREYLTSRWGEVTIVVKVNPRDVVAVPKDYNNSKMRVCRYQVTQVLGEDAIPSMYTETRNDIWDNAPEWAQWHAIDDDGEGFYYKTCPRYDGKKWCSEVFAEDDLGTHETSDPQSSLTPRPVG